LRNSSKKREFESARPQNYVTKMRRLNLGESAGAIYQHPFIKFAEELDNSVLTLFVTYRSIEETKPSRRLI
jgi:hypothetical protein